MKKSNEINNKELRKLDQLFERIGYLRGIDVKPTLSKQFVHIVGIKHAEQLELWHQVKYGVEHINIHWRINRKPFAIEDQEWWKENRVSWTRIHRTFTKAK